MDLTKSALLLCLFISVTYCRIEFDYRIDYYGTLGLKRGVSDNEIKKTYRALSLKYHPDKNPDPGALEKFRSIAAAYEVLTDPELRQQYDDILDNGIPREDWDVQHFGAKYRAYYGAPHHELGPTLVIIVVVFTVGQYLYLWYRYWDVQNRVRQTNSYKTRVKQLQGSSGRPKKKAARRAKGDDDGEDGATGPEVEIVGCTKPKITDLTLVTLLLIPFHFRTWYTWLRIYLRLYIFGRMLSKEDRLWWIRYKYNLPDDEYEKIKAKIMAEPDEPDEAQSQGRGRGRRH